MVSNLVCLVACTMDNGNILDICDEQNIIFSPLSTETALSWILLQSTIALLIVVTTCLTHIKQLWLECMSLNYVFRLLIILLIL